MTCTAVISLAGILTEFCIADICLVAGIWLFSVLQIYDVDIFLAGILIDFCIADYVWLIPHLLHKSWFMVNFCIAD